MHDPGSRGEPLNIALPISGGCPERVRVIDVAAPDHGDGLETAMRVLGKAGHDVTVVHAPAVEVGEVRADLPSGQGLTRTKEVVSGGIRVDVMNGEDERIETCPGKAQIDEFENGLVRDEVSFTSGPIVRPLR
jgi:hypothetical protein